MQSPDDLIAAVATAPGGAMRSIIRVSGRGCGTCLDQTFVANDGGALKTVRTPRLVSGNLLLAEFRRRIPCDIYFWPTSQSFTRQPVAEIHTIGSPPLVQAALRAVCAYGARLARPGEFTLRAFLAGRIDLPQAEAVLGVIDAASQREFHTALAQLGGGVSQPMGEIRNRLLDLLADIEAGLDFVEDDIDFVSTDTIRRVASSCADLVDTLIDRLATRSLASLVPRVILWGWPNVGKSSLFNALTHQGQALVSDGDGTTRDYLTARIDLDGIECQLVDTAGVRPPGPQDELEAAAQKATAQQATEAHLQILCLDASRPPNPWELEQLSDRSSVPRMVAWTKCDLAVQPSADEHAVRTSARTGAGLVELRRRIRPFLDEALGSSHEGSVVAETSARCRGSLAAASESLRRVVAITDAESGEELVADEIRVALDHLGEVVGAIYTDDILDRIFSRFCIGK